MHNKRFTQLIISFILILALINITASNIYAIPNSPDEPRSFAKQYLLEKANVLSTGQVDALDSYFSNREADALKYQLYIKKQLLQDYLLAFTNSNYAIKKVFPKIKLSNLHTEGDSCSLTATLTAYIHWNRVNAYSEPITGIITEKHYIVLKREDGFWKVVSDKFQTDRGLSEQCQDVSIDELSKSVEELKTAFQSSLKRSKSSPPTELKLMPPSFNRDRKERSTYNSNGAVNWAKKYWQNYSDEFVNLGDQEWEGGDCTNFVSQCLRAGGAENDTKGSFKWYYNKKGISSGKNMDFSWTWSTARGLNSILLGNYRKNEFGPKGTEKTILGDSNYTGELGEYINTGDIIQYEFTSSAGIKHSAIIVGMVQNTAAKRYEPVIATHSFDSWNLPWTKDAYKTHFVHITGIN